MKVWGVTEDEIVEQARQNTPGQRHVLMRSILEVICGASGSGEGQYPEAFGQMPMYVLTNEQQVYGAACMHGVLALMISDAFELK